MSGQKKPHIFIVEDNVTLQKAWGLMFGRNTDITMATSIPEAEMVIEQGLDHFDLILMDCCVPGHQPNTAELVQKIRQSGYKGIILANSSNIGLAEDLLPHGADIAVEKGEVASKVRTLLG